MGKPDLSKSMGATLADRGSAFYTFTQHELLSQDGQRHYRIWLAVPKRAAPTAGYPVLYLLDGNAALAALQEKQLADVDGRSPPVLVFLGYASDLRFDVNARAYDYTPPLPGAKSVLDDIARDRLGGGADVFLDLLEQRIKPWVQQQVAIDPQRQALWGHSYAGLLTLHTLFTRPYLFQCYIAVEPSVWWQQGFILREEREFVAAAAASFELTLLLGSHAVRDNSAASDSDPLVRARRQAMAAVPADAAIQLARRLAALPQGLVRYRQFYQLGHGPMLPASLGPALRLIAGDAEAVPALPVK